MSFSHGLRAAAAVTFAFTILGAAGLARAAILTVGSTAKYHTIQAAVNAAASGDTIAVQSGTYGAAYIGKSNLTIEGVGTTMPVIQGTVYGGKGLFVISGSNTTVIDLNFKNATDGAGNGAGIRMQGTNLTVLNSKFVNNQDGILSDWNTASTITVKNSGFYHNGTCAGSGGCAHALYAGHIGKLDVENSTFQNTQAGHSIKSRANTTVVLNNRIVDTTTGTSAYSIDVPNGGAVTITGNYIEKGPKSTNGTSAIAMGEEGATNPAGAMLIANNTFQNDRPKTQEFIWNKTGNPALVVSGNLLLGIATDLLQGAGTIQTARSSGVTSLARFSGRQGASFNAAPPRAVPEPASLALFGTALIGLAFFGMRRKASAA